MNKQQIQRLLDIPAEHGVEVPEHIIKEWEKLTPEQFSKILELALHMQEKDD